MQALDSFISPIPGFDGDILIPIIPVSARPPGGEAIDDPAVGANVGASKTQAGKRKATANPTPQKKAKKATGKSSSGIKINEPVPKAPASTPPSGPRKGIPVHRLRRYTCLEYFFFIDYFVNCEPLCIVPQDMNPVSVEKSVPAGSEPPKVDKPQSPQAEKTTSEPPKPPSPKGVQGPINTEGASTSPTHVASSRDAASNSPRAIPTEFPEMSPPSRGPMDLGLPVDRNQAKARLWLGPSDSIRVLQSPSGII
jgi:hypothetical protein